MMRSLRQQWSIYGVFLESIPKLFLAYRGWVWMNWVVDVVGMLIFFYFWTAVYANTSAINGVGYTQLISYILFIRAISVNSGNVVGFIGYGIREGQLIYELMRPVDFQLRLYIEAIGHQLTSFATSLPILLVALALGAQLPTTPAVWLSFVVTFVIGHAINFLVSWCIACITFYTTEVWGIMVLIYSLFQFFSGEMIPINLMPQWLQSICYVLPFAQTRFVPFALLSGTLAPEEALSRIGVQIIWLVGMAIFSRWLFSRAIRVITVQGG